MINLAQLTYAINIETREQTELKFGLICLMLEDESACWQPLEVINEVLFLFDMRSAALFQMALNDYMAEG
jgi:hypothetical protein